jgi:hypothetical protein
VFGIIELIVWGKGGAACAHFVLYSLWKCVLNT